MDFTLTDDQETFRATVRQTLDALVNNDVRRSVVDSGVAHNEKLSRALAGAGLFRQATSGPDHDPVLLHLMFSEMEKAGAPYEGIAVNLLVAGVLDSVGTDLHRRCVAAPLLAGEKSVCLGYSEPDAGSDLTRVKTRSRRSEDRWIINGQKLWTTLAQDAAWMFALTRTDATADTDDAGPKRRDATLFIIPMDAEGVRVDAVRMMGGERVNAVFLDDVVVSDDWRVGDVNRAWDVMGLALSLERGVLGNSQLAVPLLAAAIGWFGDSLDADGARLLDDPAVREAIARVAIDNQVGSLLGLRAAVDRTSPPGIAGSEVKIFVSERYVRAARLLQDLAGPAAVLDSADPDAAAQGWIAHHVSHSPLTRIAGGTTEINRNNVAERLLGLPRVR